MSNIEAKIASVRRFNRFYTRTIGVLGDGIQRTPYTLTEARLLFELAQTGSAETVALRQRLGLDAGYVSRIFTRFEADGLVALERSTVDGRRQVVTLTEAGRRAFQTLSDNAIEDMGALLHRLGESDQRRLLAAMATIERLWDGPPSEGGEVVIREPLPGELGWVVQRHGELYADEYGWNDEFEALVAGIVGDFVKARRPGRDAAWIAQVGDAPAGSIFCVGDDTTARLRLLLVEPWARGKGVGGKLIEVCLAFARLNRYKKMVLWTNAELHAARRLYEKAGFQLVSEERGESFGRPQVFQNWSLLL